MKPGGWLALAVPFILAAAPAPGGSLPLPPIPPAHPPNEGPAPTPDRDAAAPLPPSSDGPTIAPRFLRVPSYQHNFDQSQGYVSGSRREEDPSDRRLLPAPGFNLRVPLK
jgi:hypothetical protein